MKNLHLSDLELTMAMDGELCERDLDRVRTHLITCWKCRARQTEFEQAATQFVQFQTAPAPMPNPDGPRALLKARMAEIDGQTSGSWWQPPPGSRFAWAGATAALLLGIAIVTDRLLLEHPAPVVVLAAPNPSLTPGAAVFEPPTQLCQETLPKNKNVSSALRRRVLAEYGVANASEKAYEVDYLITPALGGSDDIHNLWPHSYANTEWNASVKDALEDRLRSMVCQGQLDLPTAQSEIATNWIAAYKKYFHTDRPLRSPEAPDQD